MIGRTIGHYKILELLGAGGMGEVYLAEDLSLKRQIAFKVLPPHLLENPQRLKRFRREAETLAGLNHPNIVTLHSVAKAEGVHFLTMEWVEGESLTRLLRQGGLPVETYFEIAIPLAEALSAAHEKGVVHRDLKPDNVMVSDKSVVKVLDFGLAKLIDSSGAEGASDLPTDSLTAEDQVLGTVPYMSPEQVRGDDADHRSDIFSLGVVLHEMATGKRLFHGSSSLQVASAILTIEPAPISEVRADLPFQLTRIVEHCLVKDRAHRFQSTRDLCDELVELKREVDSGQIRTHRLSAVSGQGRRRTWRAFRNLSLVTVVIMLALAVFFQVQKSSERVSGYESIAVMPFENLTGDPSRAYQSDGLSSGLIVSLSEVAGLSVVSRSEAWSHRDEGLGVRSLASRLEVQAVIEGDLQADGNDLRAAVTLTDGSTGVVLWSAAFKGSDVPSIGRDMAKRVAAVLSVPLTARERRRLARNPTRSLKAYDYYLQGEQFLEELSTPRHEELAADLFRKALQIDDRFALARVGLSESYWKRYQREKENRFLEMAEDEARLALEIDSDLQAARVALARVYRSTGRYALSIADLRQALSDHPRPDRAMRELAFGYEQAGDLEAAETSLRAAVDANEEHWQNWHSLGALLMRLGRYDEAKDAFAYAIDRSPESITWSRENLATIKILEGDFAGAIADFEALGAVTHDPFLADNMATAYFFVDRLDEAEQLYLTAVRLSPSEPRFHGNLGDLYMRQNRSDLAKVEYQKALQLAGQASEKNPRNTELRLTEAIYASKARQCTVAEELAETLETDLPATAYNLHDLALVYALCENAEATLRSLERAVQQGFSAEYIATEDEFRFLEGDSRFRALQE